MILSEGRRKIAEAASGDGLVMTDIHHAYGRTPVLNGVSVEARAGQLTCLLGPSGCGKTTLLRLAAGLEVLQDGEIRIAGQVVATPQRQEPPERRSIGLAFQDFALFPHLTVEQNVAFGLRRWQQRSEARARVKALLARVGLDQFAAAYPHTLSGGQQQRVALARALAPGPRVMLLDEPFSSLDVVLRHQVREHTLGILREEGVASLLVTHDPEEAMFAADHICVMHPAGWVVQAGVPADIYRHPKDAYVTTLFGPVTRFPARVSDGHAETPWGRLPASRDAGPKATVLVRPEALLVSEEGHRQCDAGVAARIVDVRTLGRATIVRIALLPPYEDLGVFTVRMRGVYTPPSDGTCRATLLPENAFVF